MILMLLWPMNAAWRTVYGWLLTPVYRMAAHARRNEDLSDAKREILRTESTTLQAKAVRVRTGGRAVEDAEDDILRRARNETVVTDSLCDAAQDETYNVLDIRAPVLAGAGTSREAVLSAPLGRIKKVGRERTVEYAEGTARRLRNLPAFPERDTLADKLERRAKAHEKAADDVDDAENLVETQHCAPLEALTNQLRVDVIHLHGRLTAEFPREFVESLFPRSERRSGGEEPPPGGEPPGT